MKALKDYFNNREDAVLDILGKSRRKFTAGTFHELRVEIKKLNALVDLIHFCSPDFRRKKALKPYKRIFRQAGKVRELQLEERLFDQQVSLSSGVYRKQLKQLRKEEQKTFFSMASNRLISRIKKKHSVLITALSGINKKKVKHYLDEREALITEILRQAPLQAKQIHEARKRLKTFNYNRMILASKKERTQLKKNDILSPLMGQWHDSQVAIQRLLKAIDSGGMEQEEVRQLEDVKAKMAADGDRLFDELNNAVPVSGFFEEEEQH